jgi:hypothetical protein
MSVDDRKPKVITQVCAPKPESEELDYEPVAEPQKRKSSVEIVGSQKSTFLF